MNCATCRVRVRTEWFALDGQDVGCLNAGKLSRAYAVGDAIFHEGDACEGLHYVAEGLIATRRFFSIGTGSLLGLRHPGDVLGLGSFLRDGVHNASAWAMRPSRVCFINRDTIGTLVARRPTILLDFLRRLSCDLDAAEQRLVDQHGSSALARLCRLLLILHMTDGHLIDEDEAVFDSPLPFADLAAAAGIAASAAPRYRQRLEAIGAARFSEDRVCAINVERLRQMSERRHVR